MVLKIDAIGSIWTAAEAHQCSAQGANWKGRGGGHVETVSGFGRERR